MTDATDLLDEELEVERFSDRYAIPAIASWRQKWADRFALFVIAIVFLGGFLSEGYALPNIWRGGAWFLCGLLGIYGLLSWSAGRWEGPQMRMIAPLLALACVPAIWWGIMLVPLPAGLVTAASPPWAAARDAFQATGIEFPASVPLAVSPLPGVHSWHQLIASICFFLGVLTLASRRKRTIQLIVILSLVLLGEGALGFVDWLVGKGRTNGALFNPNHTAALIVMLLPVYFAAIVVWSRVSRSLGTDIAGGSNPLLLLFGLGAVALVAWMTCFSRASLLFGGGTLSLWILVEVWGRSKEFDFRGNSRLLARNLVLAGSLGIIAVGALVILVDSADAVQGFLNRAGSDRPWISVKDAGRFDMWRATLKGLAEVPFTGLGPAGAQGALGRFAEISTQKASINSHNDYIQCFAELGVPAALLAAAAAGWFLWRLRGDFSARREHFEWSERILPRAALAGLVGICLHSGVEFPLRIPMLGFAFLTLLAILLCPGALFVTTWAKRRR